ncbi:MAG: hypothetical protein O3A39_04715 [Proteobacteria bacterium]|nr:hypothetical protein [Pseudomonadota bacterium]
MTDVNSSIPEYTEIELLRKTINDLVLALAAQFDNKIEALDKVMETYEKQIATLATGFAEQAVFIEALLGQLNFTSDESKKNFHNSVHEARQKMFQIMKEGANGIVADENPRLASAVEDVVDSKSSNPAD